MTVGAEARLVPKIVVKPDGTRTVDLTAGATMRTDMWEPWLIDAIEAAHLSVRIAAQMPTAKVRADPVEIGGLIGSELRASMRTVTSCCFALDALYASVKGRASRQPSQSAARPARWRQVAEMFRYQLKLAPSEAKRVRDLLGRLFELRDAAAHPSASFRDVVYRDDIGGHVDWHHGTFRSRLAVDAIRETMAVFEILVDSLANGDKGVAAYADVANRVFDPVRQLFARSGLAI